MGLFDGFEAGWNSFKNKELQQVTDWVKDNTDLDKKVTEYVKSEPEKAKKIVEQPVDSAFNQLFKLKSGKVNIGGLSDEANKNVLNLTTGTSSERATVLKDAAAKGLEESTQPIWDRDSTKKALGEDGADKLQDAFNPARWAENAIDNTTIIPDNAKDTVKTYLPIVALGAGALILLSALK